MAIGTVITAILFTFAVVGGSAYLLGAAVAMWRAPDALSRLNQLSAGVMVGVPLLVAGNLILEFDQGTLTVGKVLSALLAVVALLIVATVASEVLGRAVLGSRDGSSEDHSDRR
ncbi:monovalent cation/H(+) antiporter subunit G [Corynebacterium hansenii]|uniref:Monovalent cation/H(+) antiporter subunit G n=1 Tax=Corynebacterium hansenii TaxID=394964 RepID=A0ABV7ZLA6_9CORY|nr:monovalent cation/H(+) antiporter subunit G [Corynebacterium hansenii]WJY98836.1 putative monovalent cation/H+ antiporter subunit G [Corynebacterium hansenii]